MGTMAMELSATNVCSHLSKGVVFTLPEQKVFLFDKFREDYLKGIAAFRDVCTDAIGDSPIKVCVENYSGYTDFERQAVDVLLESPVFGLTWDLGHWHKGKIDDAPFMLERRERLVHFHVHDAGEQGDHLALGDGEIDIERMVALAKELNARCVIETKTAAALKKSVKWLHERGWMQKNKAT